MGSNQETSSVELSGKVLAIMQPYFFPYIGYFQLIAAADQFVVYDNIQYTKRGWINRNRMLQGAKDAMFTLPVKKASDYLDVAERELAESFDRRKLFNQIRGAYAKAPFLAETLPLIESVVMCEESNLFAYIHNSLSNTVDHLGIETDIVVSSTIDVDCDLRGQDRVIATCEALEARTYLNPEGGTDLYAGDAFSSKGIELRFIRSLPFEYPQFGAAFVPSLSIIDVMMFNSIPSIRENIQRNFEIF